MRRRKMAAGMAILMLAGYGPIPAAAQPTEATAIGQMRLLFGRMDDIRRGGTEDDGGSGDALGIAVGDESVPPEALAGLVPGGAGTFLSGQINLGAEDGRSASRIGIETDGLAAGTDVALSDRTRIGISLGYAAPATDFGPRTEAGMLAIYGFHTEGAVTVEAIAGAGRARFRDEEASGGGGLVFGAVGVEADFWTGPEDRLGIRPALRVSYADADPGTDGASGVMTVALALEAEYRFDFAWGSVVPYVNVGVERDVAVRVGSPVHVQDGGAAAPPRSAMRLGVAAHSLDEAITLTLDHETYAAGGAPSHAISARLMARF